MASSCNDPGWKKRITWVDPHNTAKRPAIRLGKCSKRDAMTVKLHVERLVAAKAMGSSVAEQTALWVGSIGDDLHSKLAAHGLVEPREKQQVVTLREFIDGYTASRADVKPGTQAKYRTTRALSSSASGPTGPSTN